MEQHQNTRGVRHPVRPIALKAMVVSLLGAGVLSTGTVAAQEVTNVITVTGQRKAAQSAQTLKKNADQVVDSIVADDIGKFPDKNVAEILQRITGVQVIRGGGEAGTVIIRGLGGIVTLLNGREFFSDAGRSLYMSDVPATMLQRIDVYKTQGGDLPEGGTAGIVDVRTNRPFDFKGATFNANARVENRDKAGTNNPDVSAMASNRWKTSVGEVGALLGVSYQRGRYADEVAFAGEPTKIKGDVIGAGTFGRFMGNGDRKREALNFALQWRPAKGVELFAEGFRTNIDHRFQNNFMLGFPPNFNDAAVVTTKPGTNYLDTITLLNQPSGGFTSTQAYQHDVVNQQYAVGGSWDISPSVRITSELATTKADFAEHRVITDFDYTAKGFVGAVRSGGGYVDFPGTNMQDPIDANFRIAGGKDIINGRGGKSTDWRSDVIWDTSENGVAGFIKEVSAGVRLAERKAFSQANKDMWWNFGPNQGRNVSNFPGLYSLSAPVAGDYGVNQYIVADKNYLLDQTAEVRRILTGSTDELGNDPLNFYDDIEKTSAIYLKTKFAFDTAVPISGVLSTRVVRTEQVLTGNSRIGTVVEPMTVDTSRTDVLPSLALRADITPKLVGRLIAGKAIERPAFTDYNPALRLDESPPQPGQPERPGTGTAGNPLLRPTRSTNLDVALEWYFAPTGSLTATLFEHKFVDRLQNMTKLEVINGRNYNVTRQYNLSKANLKGAELSYRQFYDGLPGLLGGLGLEANFTYMTGKQINPDGVKSTFLGQSKTSYNLVGLYERGAVSARLAYNWRSKFLSESPYRNFPDLNLYVAPLRSLDGSISYRLNKNLTLTLDGNNLLDQPYHDYFNQDEGLVRDTRRYDRAVGLALHYKY